MSESKAHPRPRQVTVAGVLAVVAAALLVVALFDAMGQVRSADTRDAVSAFLRRPPGDGLGIGVDQTLRILRGMVLVNGALAAAAVVLGVYVLLGNAGARIGLSVAAAVLLFTAPFSGGVLPIVLAAAAVMLWTAPARDWFAGRPPRPLAEPVRSERPADGRDEPRHDVPTPTSHPASGWATPHAPVPSEGTPDNRPAPSPYPFGGPAHPTAPPQHGQPYGQPTQPHAQQQTPQGGWPAPPAYGAPQNPWPYAQQPHGRGARPGSVTAAAWLTWIFSGLTVLLYGGMLAMLAGVRDQLLSAVQQDDGVSRLNMSGDDLVRVLWVAGVVIVFWCLSSMVLAVLAYRGQNWARVLLAVSAAFAGLFSLAAFPVGLLVTVAAGVTVALLLVPASNDWFAGRAPRSAGYYAPYGQPPAGQAPFGPQAPTPPSGPQEPPYPGSTGAEPPAAPPAPREQGGAPDQDRDRDERDNVW